MPTFCRHNRLVQNCPICSKEQQIEMRAVISSSTPASTRPRGPGTGGSAEGAARPRRASGGSSGGGAGGLRVRRLARGADDGYHSPYLMGLRSSAEAERLAGELAFSAARLDALEHDPPGLYADVADPAVSLEERTWLAFLIAYIGPLEDADDPFEELRRLRVPWESGESPRLHEVRGGARTAYDGATAERTLAAYRAWAGRAGSQQAAFAGEAGWTPARRFARVFERLALPGFHRDARFELLVSLGRLGCYELAPESLHLAGSGEVPVAAKRALGIGDPLLLDRRAAALAGACGVPLEVLDLALHNWGSGRRARVGVQVDEDQAVLDTARHALGLA